MLFAIQENTRGLLGLKLYEHCYLWKEISAVKVSSIRRSGGLRPNGLKYQNYNLDLLLHQVMEWHCDHKNKEITIAILRILIAQGYREDSFNEKQ